MSILFTPISIGSMTVKNRFVRSATQDWFGDDQGHLTDRSYAFMMPWPKAMWASS